MTQNEMFEDEKYESFNGLNTTTEEPEEVEESAE